MPIDYNNKSKSVLSNKKGIKPDDPDEFGDVGDEMNDALMGVDFDDDEDVEFSL